jgi:hypothetical protein
LHQWRLQNGWQILALMAFAKSVAIMENPLSLEINRKAKSSINLKSGIFSKIIKSTLAFS